LAHDDAGVVHVMEAAMASVMVMAVLFYVNSTALMPGGGLDNGLRVMSSDILCVMEHRPNSIEHPALGPALSSATQWNESSSALDADIRHMLPAGVYFYMDTPYGAIGQSPADSMHVDILPFEAYGGAGQMLDCRLALWRP
jgi:hypothetical protein